MTPFPGSTHPLAANRPVGRPLRVLYAEDLPELRQLLHIILAQEGHSLEAHGDGRLALARLVEAPGAFDLLVTDHHMPVMNGLNLVRQVRRLPFAGRIIILSSELAPEVHDAYVALHVDRVLAKPVRPAAFRHLLHELFPVARSA